MEQTKQSWEWVRQATTNEERRTRKTLHNQLLKSQRRRRRKLHNSLVATVVKNAKKRCEVSIQDASTEAYVTWAYGSAHSTTVEKQTSHRNKQEHT